MKDPKKRVLNVFLYSLTIPIAFILSYFAIDQNKLQILLLITPLFLVSAYVLFINISAISTGRINKDFPKRVREVYLERIVEANKDKDNLFKDFCDLLNKDNHNFYYVYDLFELFVMNYEKKRAELGLPKRSKVYYHEILKSYISCNKFMNKYN